jgi:hypothetical protein
MLSVQAPRLAHGQCLQISFKDQEVGAPDDIGLETFKKGAVLAEEEQPHAGPQAQWGALKQCLKEGASISQTSAVMREICDAVDHEVAKEVRALQAPRPAWSFTSTPHAPQQPLIPRAAMHMATPLQQRRV